MTGGEDIPLEMPIPFGISADTGFPMEDISAEAMDHFRLSPAETAVEQQALADKIDPSKLRYGTVGEVDPNVLTEVGWAVMFAPSVTPRIREALQPLLDHRRQEVQNPELFQIFEGPSGYRPGWTASQWLNARGISMDVVEPVNGVPYHLLIVGPPGEIPFEFQYGLDLYWGVGRIWFDPADDSREQFDNFRQYADSVVRYETMAVVPAARQVAMFAPRHHFDAATQVFGDAVAGPLATWSTKVGPVGTRQRYAMRPFIGPDATRDSLYQILSGSIQHGSPAVLFTGGHGKSFRLDDARQRGSQGALICQDWPGYGKLGREDYFDASDIPRNAKVHGLVHFLFACYGGGWPEFDSFRRLQSTPRRISERPMLARLPQALLSHPNGSALAVLAHIDRSWAWSFRTGRTAQAQGFRDVIGRILRGDRLGCATDQFNMRWAALSTELAEMLPKPDTDPKRLASAWVARDDARNYVLFGDPAVRLRVQDMPVLPGHDERPATPPLAAGPC